MPQGAGDLPRKNRSGCGGGLAVLPLVLFLSRPPNRVRKCLCKVRSLNIVASIGRDDMGVSLFPKDKVH